MGISLASIRQQMQSKIGQLFQWGRKYPILSIVLILFMLPFFNEGWNIARVTYLVNNAARQGARQAATGQYDSCIDEGCSSSDEYIKAAAVDNARMASIHRVVHETLEDTSSTGNALGQTHITVCSSAPFSYDPTNDRCLPRDHPGEPESLVLVSVGKDYVVGGALGSGVISLPIRAQQTMLVESFRMTRSISVPPKMLIADSSASNATMNTTNNAMSSTTTDVTTKASSADGAEKLIIAIGSLYVNTEKVENVAEQIISIADTNGGYLSASSSQFEKKTKSINIQIRVPADKFNNVLSQIKKLDIKILNEKINRKDVTEEYVDLEARLRGMQATANRITDFLEKADTVSDALKVSTELDKVQQSIEQTTGKKKYLENLAVLATLDISISEPTPVSVVESDKPAEAFAWHPSVTIEKAWNFLLGIIYFTGDVLIWIVIVALPIVLMMWVLGKIALRARKPKTPIEK